MNLQLVNILSSVNHKILKENSEMGPTRCYSVIGFPILIDNNIYYASVNHNLYWNNDNINIKFPQIEKLISATIHKLPYWTDLVIYNFKNNTEYNCNIIKLIKKTKNSFVKSSNKIIPKNQGEKMKLITINDNVIRNYQVKYESIIYDQFNISDIQQLYLKFTIEDESIIQEGLSGSPIIKNNNKLVGIVAKINKDEKYILAIPSIYMNKLIERKINNYIPSIPIFVSLTEKKKLKMINDYYPLKRDDVIEKIDDYKINETGLIYYNRVGRYIDIDSYILLEHSPEQNENVKFNIKRDGKIMEIKVPISDLNSNLTIQSTYEFKYHNKANKNFIKLTLNMIEYLLDNNVILNERFLRYIKNNKYSNKKFYITFFKNMENMNIHVLKLKQNNIIQTFKVF